MPRGNTNRFEAIYSLLLVDLLTIGLVVSTAIPVLAGSGSFNGTASMNVERSHHTATLLANSQVPVTRGLNANGYLASAEFYDPAKGKWTLTGSMRAFRKYRSDLAAAADAATRQC